LFSANRIQIGSAVIALNRPGYVGVNSIRLYSRALKVLKVSADLQLVVTANSSQSVLQVH